MDVYRCLWQNIYAIPQHNRDSALSSLVNLPNSRDRTNRSNASGHKHRFQYMVRHGNCDGWL